MTTRDEIQVLRQGALDWNDWRRQNPDVRPYLRDADLRGQDLEEINLSGSYMRGASLNRAKMAGANLARADLSRADLSDAELDAANLSGADLSAAIMRRTRLRDADLSQAQLQRTDLVGCELTGANLSGASLNGADLRKANLEGAIFRWARLEETQFARTIVGETVFANVDLSNTIGMKHVLHHGRSTIGIDTILRSNGKISKEFLRGTGLPEDLVNYMLSIADQVPRFHSCFISHSNDDQNFVEKLYADLQDKGVRCWFAPEDMKIGDPIRPRIGGAIDSHDKLLLILSSQSLTSTWVASEVEAALEKERQNGGTMLFPITLDNAVWDSAEAWASKVRRERHIGDFRQWKDHYAYQVAFERLLRDLKAERG